mgnify:CR=1 FL=1
MRNYNCELIGTITNIEVAEDINFVLNIKRSNGKEDFIPCFSSNINKNIILTEGSYVRVLGVVKSIKKDKDYRPSLRVDCVFVEELKQDSTIGDKNKVFGRFQVKYPMKSKEVGSGTLVKDIILESTPNGIPDSEFKAVIWNDYVTKFDKIQQGTEVYVIGRIQSRDFMVQTDDGGRHMRSHEVTVIKMWNDSERTE